MKPRREPTDEERLGYLAETMRIIEKHGVAIQFVFGGEDHAFGYTVGLTRKGHPELLIVGLPQNVTHYMLNRLAAIVRNGGHTFTHGEVVTDVLRGGVPLRIHGPVDDRHVQYPANTALTLYGEGVRVLQVLWPDPNGRFGDDPEAKAGAVSPVLPRRDTDGT